LRLDAAFSALPEENVEVTEQALDDVWGDVRS
jgi:hypothetical protein